MRIHSFFLIAFSTAIASAKTVEKIPEVTTRHITHKTSFSGAGKSIVTQSMINASGHQSLLDILKSRSEMQIHDASGNGSQAGIGIRGFGANASSNSLVLLNGIPLTNPDMAPPDLNIIPLSAINRVEITAGSESVLYGDQAVGGIINILTDNTRNKELQVQCGAGSYRTRDCRLSFTNYYRNFDYQASLNHHDTDNYRQHNHAYNDTLLASVSQSDNFNVDYKLTHESLQFPGALTAAQVSQNRTQASNATDYFKDTNQFLHLNKEISLFKTWKLRTDMFINDMNGIGVLMSDFSQSRRNVFIKPLLSATYDNIRIKTGADAQLSGYHLGSSFGVTNNQQKLGSLFALVNDQVTPKLTLAAGIRGAEQSTQLNTYVSAHTINRVFVSSLSAAYQVTKSLTARLRRAGNYRFPKADESTTGSVPLRTQRGVSLEAGLTYQQLENLFDLSVFQLNLRDEIAFNPLQTPQNPFGSNENLAPTQRTGTAFSVRAPFTPKITGDGQISFINARFNSGVNSGNRIPLVADTLARGGLQYRIDNHWQIYGEAVFTGNEFPANDNGNVSGKQGGYTVYNFNIRYRFKYFNASLHFNNIFNKYYYLYTVYQPGPITEYFYPAPDRNFMITLTAII